MDIRLENVLEYEQPTKYIVKSENYSDDFALPVLTAGKSFVLGYTDETEGVCKASESPVIIFDDFTADCKYVDFDFKVKSSAMKILHKVNAEDNLKYYFYAMQAIDYTPFSHKRVWISEYSKFRIENRSVVEQNNIVKDLDTVAAAIDNAKQRLNALDELVKSRFIEMFGDPDTNSNSLPVCYLGELYTVGSSKRIYQSEQTTEGVPFLRISDLIKKISSGIIEPELFISREKYAELKHLNVVPNTGDILITSRGTLGQCYIIQETDKFYFQDGMISWLYNADESVTPLYLVNLFEMSGFRKQIASMQSGSTVNYLSISRLKKLQSEQNRCAMACQGCGAFFLLFLKKAVTGSPQDSIVKAPPITNFKHGLSPDNCL